MVDLVRAYREDDMMAWIMFLLFILPMPFLYAYLDNVFPQKYSSLMVSFWTFLLTALFWYSLYWFVNYLEGSDEEGVEDSEEVL